MKKIFFLVLISFYIVHPVCAQDSTDAVDNEQALQAILNEGALSSEFGSSTLNQTATDIKQRILMRSPNIQNLSIPSLFFTNREVNLIDHSLQGLVARTATDEEITRANEALENTSRGDPGVRELSLGGVLYLSASDWVIWLNGQKITPKRLPAELLDITVGKDFVKLKWFDAYTNQIFPIKLKAHQRFNLDSRIFLPG